MNKERDKEMEATLAALRAAWHRCPHLRLCQLIVNATCSTDPFYVEDTGLAESLRQYGTRS